MLLLIPAARFHRTEPWLVLAACLLLAVVLGCPATQPPSSAPGTPKPAPARETDAAKPDSAKPDSVKPNTAKPDSAEPGTNTNPGDAATSEATVLAAAPTDPVDPGYAQPRKHIDPIKVNGKYFEGWDKPRVALVLTAEQLGYLEPCGCAGIENQKGGLRRRYTFLKQLRDKGWPVVPLELGGLVRRFGRQAEIQFQTTAEALKQMDYEAVGLGTDDLRLPSGEVVAAIAPQDPKAGTRFVSANVTVIDPDVTSRFRVIEVDGMKIGVTSVLGDEMQGAINNSDVTFRPAADALQEVLPKLEAAKCDHLVLLSYAKPAETQKLMEAFPQFDVVVTAGGAEEPPRERPQTEAGKPAPIEVGHKGMYAIVLGFYGDNEAPKYQRVALDSRFPDAPEVTVLLTAYQEQLKDLGWEGLGLRAIPHPRASSPDGLEGQFVGSTKCGTCHKAAMAVWTKTHHERATETLAKLKPQRQFDPECISCHATGWNAEEYFPYQTGYESLKKTPHLAGNGCENCHGPGAAHVKAEGARDLSQRDAWRKTMAEATIQESCIKCHDHDNSPEFDFDTYWPKVEHKGKK